MPKPDDDSLAAFDLEIRAEIFDELMEMFIARGAIKLSKDKTSYDFDLSRVCSGRDGFVIGRAIATTVRMEFGDEVDVFFCPNYAAIPFMVYAAQYYSLLVGRDTEWCFPRGNKEYTGAVLNTEKRTVILDDTINTGETLLHAIQFMERIKLTPLGCCLLVDRERLKKRTIGINQLRVTNCTTLPDILKKLGFHKEKTAVASDGIRPLLGD